MGDCLPLVIANAPAGTLTYSMYEGLVARGATVLFLLYVVLTTLNEKGAIRWG